MARRLFGTDGIRGVAGEPPLDARTAYAVGAALGKWAIAGDHPGEVVIGMDTRESGPWLAAEVAGGLASHGVKTRFAGVTTTPGVAFLARNGPFAAGAMISASHNPYRDNGIKLIDHSGYKFPDEVEESLESEIFALLEQNIRPAPIALDVDEGLDRTYIDRLAATLPASLDGLAIVVDCANGSASKLAPALLERLGARVHAIGASPDGRNINRDCGSLHLDGLRKVVLERGATLGVAFDGDADRALFVSHSGKIVDGDAILLIVSRFLLERGSLRGPNGEPVVVATVMSNLGLERALGALGVRLIRTAVGDKYVLEEMLRLGAAVGGEQSGHVIFSDYATTGDGMLTALRVLEAMRAGGGDLDALTQDLRIYPQLLVNVRVKRKLPLDELPGVTDEIRAAEESFGSAGRVLVRFSGTEPLARVMVEGPDLERVEAFAHRIASQIQSALGAE
jgi:phosphoglucosamine mutase